MESAARASGVGRLIRQSLKPGAATSRSRPHHRHSTTGPVCSSQSRSRSTGRLVRSRAEPTHSSEGVLRDCSTRFRADSIPDWRRNSRTKFRSLLLQLPIDRYPRVMRRPEEMRVLPQQRRQSQPERKSVYESFQCSRWQLIEQRSRSQRYAPRTKLRAGQTQGQTQGLRALDS